MVAVASWGRLGRWEHQIKPLAERRQVAGQLRGSTNGIAFGNGRSYGDICLNPQGTLWMTKGLDRFIRFDRENGRLTCEAGMLLRDIQRLVIPCGWSLAVTPGTQLVTVGGAIANDVHGKNHHRCGSFGDHVRRLTLVRTDGQELDVQAGTPWMAATVGGMGLTGIITMAELQLRPVSGPWLHTETIPYYGLDRFFRLADESEAQWEHTVAWVDCLAGGSGRGVFLRANPADLQQSPPAQGRQLSMPLVPPVSLVNSLSLRAFNQLYFLRNQQKAGPGTAYYQSFFYPLDGVQNWNRMYGPKGFYQYQCVVPRPQGQAAIQAMLDAIAAANEGSFLAVLKTFGQRQSVGMLSFPCPGVTLALDFPNRGPRTVRLFERLDAIVRQAGGRIYPAKDARMPLDMFAAGYPGLAEFEQYRDPGLSSSMSRRLMGS